MLINELDAYLKELLNADRYRDYCPNGLQVGGRPTVGKIVSGVTANLELLEKAAADGADAVLVHHGLFWKGDDARVVGMKRARLKALLDRDINLFAYHLPLDGHAALGNNAQLARRLGWTAAGQCGEQNLVWHGAVAPQSLGDLAQGVARALSRVPLVIGDPGREIRRVAWCTGSAGGFIDAALAAGADAYLTGEISEQHVHAARECGVALIAAGHHATERYGVQAVGEHLAQTFGVAHRFIDVDSPV